MVPDVTEGGAMGVFMPQRYHFGRWPVVDVVDVVDLVDGFFIPTYAWEIEVQK